MTIKDSFDLFLKNGSTYWADSTKVYYEKNCTYFFRYLEDRYGCSMDELVLSDLPSDILSDYVIWLRDKERFSGHPLQAAMNVKGKVKTNTVRTYMRAVKTYFNFLYDFGYSRTRYTVKLKLPRSDYDQIQPLLASEVVAVDQVFNRDVPNDLRNLCIIHLMLDAGLRSSEVCSLRVDDVILHSRTIIINQGKGNKSRAVIMCSLLYGLLADYCSLFHPTGYFFHKARSAGPIDSTVMHSLFQRIIRNTGIFRIHPHLLRHTFATSYIMGGGNLETLRILLGHFDYSVTRNYLHLASQNQILKTDIYRLDPVFFERAY